MGTRSKIIVPGSEMYEMNLSLYFEGDFETGKLEQIYPCHCGMTHRGDYALYDYAHHNCMHDKGIILLESDQGVCGECGKAFRIYTES